MYLQIQWDWRIGSEFHLIDGLTTLVSIDGIECPIQEIGGEEFVFAQSRLEVGIDIERTFIVHCWDKLWLYVYAEQIQTST